MLKKAKEKIEKNKILLFSLVVLLSVFIEVVIFNGYSLYKMRDNLGQYTIPNENVKIETVTKEEEIDFSIKKTIYNDAPSDDIEPNYQIINNKKNIITIKFDKKYVNKVKINYHTKSKRAGANVSYLSYEKFDQYGNPYVESDHTQFPYNVSSLVKNIDNRIDNIKIEIEKVQDDIVIDSVEVLNTFIFNWIRFICILLINISLALMYLLRDKFAKKLELLFVIVSLCVGSILVVVIPNRLYLSWDDSVHFQRAYTMFDSEICYTDSYNYIMGPTGLTWSLPESYEEHLILNNYLNENNKCVKKDEFSNPNLLISYDNISYIPSGVVIKLCKILNIPFSIMFKLGKLINLLIYTLIGYFAIKNAKVGKRLIFLLLLLPTNLFLATQYSKDPYITPFLILGISTFINIYVSKDKATLKSIMIIALSIILGSCPKMIYIPFLALLLFIPKDRFKNNKQSVIVKLIILLMLLLSLASFILPNTSTSGSSNYDIRGVKKSSGGQVSTILEQPVSFAKVFVPAFFEYAGTYFTRVESLANFCKYNLLQNGMYYLLLIVYLFVIFTGENSKYKIPLKIKMLFLGLSSLVICFIMGSMYLYYSTVASTKIDGVQCRYFLPIFFPVLLLFNNHLIQVKITDKKYNIIMTLILMFISIYYIYNNIFIPFAK